MFCQGSCSANPSLADFVVRSELEPHWVAHDVVVELALEQVDVNVVV